MHGSLQRVIHMSTAQLITYLDLAPHPEGGWYCETWKVDGADGSRPMATGIYYLLAKGERSHWHRIDASELWVFHAGAPLRLSTAETQAGPAEDTLLGSELASAHLPQFEVKPGHWQSAQSTGDWTLCSCICAPGFTFDTFELAPADFEIPRK